MNVGLVPVSTVPVWQETTGGSVTDRRVTHTMRSRLMETDVSKVNTELHIL